MAAASIFNKKKVSQKTLLTFHFCLNKFSRISHLMLSACEGIFIVVFTNFLTRRHPHTRFLLLKINPIHSMIFSFCNRFFSLQQQQQ